MGRIKLKDILMEAKGDIQAPGTFNNEKAVEKFLFKKWVPWTRKERRGSKIVYKLETWNVGYYHIKNKTLVYDPTTARPKEKDCEQHLKDMHLSTKYSIDCD